MMSLVASDTYVKAKSLLDAGDYSGVDLMKEAALAGNPYAQTCYGKILVEGDHVNKDNKKAAELFRKAALSGKNTLSLRNPDEAAEIFGEAAEKTEFFGSISALTAHITGK